jgi:hypothetical protein
VHWKGNRGIVAARNPRVEPSVLKVRFDPADGLDAGPSNLVLERVYPTRWISPRLYRSGDVTDLPLEGFETAVYEVYPLEDAARPLIAGARFDERILGDGRYAVTVFEGKPLLLNPTTVSAISVEGDFRKDLKNMDKVLTPPPPVSLSAVRMIEGGATISANIEANVGTATVALLVRPDANFAGKELPRCTVRLDDNPADTAREEGKGSWAWYRTTMRGGNHRIELRLPDGVRWKGSVSAWILTTQQMKGKDIILTAEKTVKTSPMPPRPWPAGEMRRTLPIGGCVLERK